MRVTAKKAQNLALRNCSTRNEDSFTLYCTIVIFLTRNLNLQKESCLCTLLHTTYGNTMIFVIFSLYISLSGCLSEYW